VGKARGEWSEGLGKNFFFKLQHLKIHL